MSFTSGGKTSDLETPGDRVASSGSFYDATTAVRSRSFTDVGELLMAAPIVGSVAPRATDSVARARSSSVTMVCLAACVFTPRACGRSRSCLLLARPPRALTVRWMGLRAAASTSATSRRRACRAGTLPCASLRDWPRGEPGAGRRVRHRDRALASRGDSRLAQQDSTSPPGPAMYPLVSPMRPAAVA